jgi:hypothetical protein
MARVESSASLDDNLRDVCNADFRLASIKSDFSRHSHGFAFVLLRIRELRSTRQRNPSGKYPNQALTTWIPSAIAARFFGTLLRLDARHGVNLVPFGVVLFSDERAGDHDVRANWRDRRVIPVPSAR